MKRKFSFSSLRLKLSSAPTEDAITPEGLDSPPYSPTPSCMERPVVSPHLIAELRVCCAIVVNETNPPDYDDVPDHREMLKKYMQERDAYRALAERRAAAKEEPKSVSRPHRQPEPSADARDPTPYRHVPRNAATNFEATTNVKKPSVNYLELPTYEPSESTHSKVSGKKSEKPQERNDALEQIPTQRQGALPPTTSSAVHPPVTLLWLSLPAMTSEHLTLLVESLPKFYRTRNQPSSRTPPPKPGWLKNLLVEGPSIRAPDKLQDQQAE
ncbi:MAG: hypothetical protein Q9184_006927 [Pyrenodesmia sp. 2 TL-2023]